MDMDTEELDDSDEETHEHQSLIYEPSSSTSTSTITTASTSKLIDTVTKTDAAIEGNSSEKMLQSNQTTEPEIVSKTLETESMPSQSVEEKPKQEDKMKDESTLDEGCSINEIPMDVKVQTWSIINFHLLFINT
jgi:hypothetical protein